MMTRSVVNRVLLLATLLLGREALLGQQQTPPQNLPDAPQPSVSAPVQPPPAGTAPSHTPEGIRVKSKTRDSAVTADPASPPSARPLQA